MFTSIYIYVCVNREIQRERRNAHNKVYRASICGSQNTIVAEFRVVLSAEGMPTVGTPIAFRVLRLCFTLDA